MASGNDEQLPILQADEDDRESNDGHDTDNEDIILDERSEADELEADEGDDDTQPLAAALPQQTTAGQQPIPTLRMVLARDNSTYWHLLPPANMIPRPIAIQMSRPTGPAIGINDPYELIKLFITDEMLEIIIRHTNDTIAAAREVMFEDYENRTITLSELNALIGCLYLSSAFKLSKLQLEELFSRTTGIAMFRAAFSFNRYKFLLRNLKFDDVLTRTQRQRHDKFTLFREIWNIFLRRCQLNYIPSSNCTIDETTLGFRGRCSFKVYNPNKPDKYGLKVFSLCDARSFYFFNGLPYTGKRPELPNVIENLKIPTLQVIELATPIFNSNRNITVDNYFQSSELVSQMLERNITVVGTMRKNRPEIPTRMLSAKRANVLKSKFLYLPDRVLTSFVPKPRKVVVLLSSLHTEEGKINEVSQKPEIIEFYNYNKAGVDTLNQLISTRSASRKTKRWTMRYFYAMLDLAAVNAFIIHQANGGQLNRFQFLKVISERLSHAFIEGRMHNPRIPRLLRTEIARYLNLPEESQVLVRPARRGRPTQVCVFCPSNLKRRGAQYCHRCGRSICGDHRIGFCPTCVANI